jgi:hypothetical protein
LAGDNGSCALECKDAEGAGNAIRAVVDADEDEDDDADAVVFVDGAVVVDETEQDELCVVVCECSFSSSLSSQQHDSCEMVGVFRLWER